MILNVEYFNGMQGNSVLMNFKLIDSMSIIIVQMFTSIHKGFYDSSEEF